MTIEEIERLMEELVFTVKAAQDSLMNGSPEDSYRDFEFEATAFNTLKEAIIEYGRESAAEAFELGRKSAKEHVT